MEKEILEYFYDRDRKDSTMYRSTRQMYSHVLHMQWLPQEPNAFS